MAISLENSRTKENLMRAFAGESQARNRYTMAADQAQQMGLYAIRDILIFTADQERAHAERFYGLLKELSGKTIEIDGGYPVDIYENMEKVFRAAAHNEFEEADDIYPKFGDIAKEEGFTEVASAFYQIPEIQRIHGERDQKIAQMLSDNTYFSSMNECAWMCTHCGHIHTGTRVPEVCPVCRHEKGFFIPLELAPYMLPEFK